MDLLYEDSIERKILAECNEFNRPELEINCINKENCKTAEVP